MKSPGDSKRVKLRHFLIFHWLIGAVLIVAVVFIIFISIHSLLTTSSDPDSLELTLFLVALTLAAGYISIFDGNIRSFLFAAVTEMDMDVGSKSVELTRYRVDGKQTEHSYFHQFSHSDHISLSVCCPLGTSWS